MSTPNDVTSETPKPPAPPVVLSKEATDFLQAEYAALRGEILKRTETQHQLFYLALFASGMLLTVGSQVSPLMRLAYPILAIFLAAAWTQNDLRVRQIGTYIRRCIEQQLLYGGRAEKPDDRLGWQHILSQEKNQDPSSSKCSKWSEWLKWLGSHTRRAAFGFFVATEFLVPVVPLLRLHAPEWAKLIAALFAGLVASIVTTILFMMSSRNAERFEDDIRLP